MGKGARKYEGSPTVSKNFMNFVLKRLKMGPYFLPTLAILFRPSLSQTL